MLYKRLLVAIVCVPLIVACIYWGPWAFLALLLMVFGPAEIEYCRLVARAGFQPAGVFGVALVCYLLAEPYLHTLYPNFDLWRLGLAVLMLVSLAGHVIRTLENAFNHLDPRPWRLSG